MLRQLVWIVPVLLLCGVGCNTCGERKPLCPKLHDFFNGNDDRELPSRSPVPPDRYDDRFAYSPAPPSMTPGCSSCPPGSGVIVNNGYGNIPMPVQMGSSYVVPGSGMLRTPQLSAPVMPRGNGTSPENELPTPGGFSNVAPAETSRAIAPKPSTSLVGK